MSKVQVCTTELVFTDADLFTIQRAKNPSPKRDAVVAALRNVCARGPVAHQDGMRALARRVKASKPTIFEARQELGITTIDGCWHLPKTAK